MMNLRDPLERLRAANPVPPHAVAVIAPDPVLLARITTAEPPGELAPARPAPAPRRRRARRLVPVLLVGSMLGGAVGYGLLHDRVTNPETVQCFESPDPDGPVQVAVVDQRGEVTACADLWQRGMIGPGGQVPPLVECVLASGRPAVFPNRTGGDLCTRLSLAPASTVPPTAGAPPTTGPPPGPAPAPPATSADVNARILSFRDEVLPQFLDSPCIELAPATAIVRRELDRAGLGDWTVRATDGFSADRPCVTLALRPESREVVMIPTPRR
jgi:hypothetical protein